MMKVPAKKCFALFFNLKRPYEIYNYHTRSKIFLKKSQENAIKGWHLGLYVPVSSAFFALRSQLRLEWLKTKLIQ